MNNAQPPISNNTLEQSWNSFSDDRAAKYLKIFGHPSISSKELLVQIIKKDSDNKPVSIIDLGCGNAQLYEYFKERGLECSYTGVDFSRKLIDVAKKNNPEATFIVDDVNSLEKVFGMYDYAIYSHVIEMLPSPENSMLKSSKIAKKIIVRFFEPPEFEIDTVELKTMETAENTFVPYLRRKMSKDYYKMILEKIGYKELEIYKDKNSRDQIHVINY